MRPPKSVTRARS